MKRFEPDRYYRPSDPEMRLIATPGTLTQWRHQGRGPSWVKCARRVLYRGSDLNDWLDANLVSPMA